MNESREWALGVALELQDVFQTIEVARGMQEGPDPEGDRLRLGVVREFRRFVEAWEEGSDAD